MSTLFIFSNFFLFNPVRQAAVLFSCNLQTAEFNWIEAQGQAGVDLCMINGSKVLIYLTLLYFIFYCTLVSNAKGNIAKTFIGFLKIPFVVRAYEFLECLEQRIINRSF